MTGDLFKAWYADSIFNEDHFLTLGGGMYQKECQEISWSAEGLHSLDPRTSEAELEVQRILNLESLTNNFPDALTDHSGLAKLHIPNVNAPERVDIAPKAIDTSLGQTPRKRGRPLGARDKVLRRRPQKQIGKPDMSHPNSVEEAQLEYEKLPEVSHSEGGIPSAQSRAQTNFDIGVSGQPDPVILGNHDELVEMNDEISTNYVGLGELYDRKMTIVDIYFASKIASIDLDPEPKSMAECQKHLEWVKWKEAIEAELHSLYKRKMFGPIV
jgi:hypothetical protein